MMIGMGFEVACCTVVVSVLVLVLVDQLPSVLLVLVIELGVDLKAVYFLV